MSNIKISKHEQIKNVRKKSVKRKIFANDKLNY